MESLTDDAVLNLELEECPVHRDVALNMGLILNELITNAIKHGPSDGFARIELSGRRAEDGGYVRSEEHTSELQSLMRISYAVFCLKKTNQTAIVYDTRTT